MFAYTTGNPRLGEDGRFQVDRSKVRVGQPVGVDEIDLDSGFLMMPAALPAPVVGPGPAGGPGGPTPPGPVGPTPPGPTPPGPIDPGPGTTNVELSFRANRNQLFTAWNALANLADMAGKVEVTVRASSQTGFDKGKLQNGVMEPLREAQLLD